MAEIFKKGQRTTIISALATISLAVLKGIIGLISGSVVLMGDAIHSAADSLSSFAAWFGLKISQKRPTKKFSYGYYKAENLTAFLISVLIIFAGVTIIRESFSELFVKPELNIPLVAIGAAILDAIVMFSIGTYEVKIGKKINSQSLVADGRESRLHLLSSSLVLIGLFAAWLEISYLEGVMGILISLFIFEAGLSSAKDSIFALMDVSPSKENEEKIEKILNNISGVREFENLRLRKSGPLIFGEVKIKIGKSIDVKRAYEISENIEKEIKRKIKAIDTFTVTVLPFMVHKQKICIPIEEDQGLDSIISEHFGRAKNFIFINLDSQGIQGYYVKNNIYQGKKIRAGLSTVQLVINEKIDSVISKEMGPISLHALRDNIVDIYWGEDGDIRNIIAQFQKNKLKPLKEPTREKI